MSGSRVASLCRLCTTGNGNKIAIFDSVGEAKQLHLKINKCLPIVVLENDSLPKNVCETCVQKVEMFNDFREFTIQSEKVLQKLLEEERSIMNLKRKLKQALKNLIKEDTYKRTAVPLPAAVKQEVENAFLGQGELIPCISDPLESETSERHEEQVQICKEDINSNETLIENLVSKVDIDDNFDCSQCNTNSDYVDNSQCITNCELSPSVSRESVEDPGTCTNGVDQPAKSAENLEIEARECISVNDQVTSQSITSRGTGMKVTPNFVCETCGKVFRGNRNFKAHVKIHKERTHACQVCYKLFARKEYMQVHAKRHNEKKFKFKCTICNKKFVTQTSLKSHTRRHTNDVNFFCQYCNKGFFDQFTLKAHENTHTGNKVYVCEKCNTQYFSYFGYNSHLSMHKNAFLCNFCQKIFQTRHGLRRHTTSHKGEENPKSYICDICGKILTSRSSLIEHQRIHSGDKPFVCFVCGKRSRTYAMYKEHMQTHNEAKLHVCNICDKSFTQAHNLTIHKRIHSGEKPYCCRICARGFTSKSALTTHEKSH